MIRAPARSGFFHDPPDRVEEPVADEVMTYSGRRDEAPGAGSTRSWTHLWGSLVVFLLGVLVGLVIVIGP